MVAKRVGLFYVRVGLKKSPQKKSNSNGKKSNTVISVGVRDNGVAKESQKVVGLGNIPMNLSTQVHLWSSGLWMLEEYYAHDSAGFGM